MQKIYLKYGIYTGDMLTIGVAAEYNCTKYYERYIRKIVKTDTLRGLKYYNKFNIRKYYNITISADELTQPAKMNYLLEFFKADTWLFSNDGVNYFGVVFDDEEFDLQYIDDIKALPEINLKLYCIEIE